MVDEKVLFTSSLDLSNHPMNNVKPKLKKQYYLVLEYFVNEQTDNKFTASRLKQYRIKLLNSPDYVEKETNIKQIIQSIINSRINNNRRYSSSVYSKRSDSSCWSNNIYLCNP